jgi:hypothetical protein
MQAATTPNARNTPPILPVQFDASGASRIVRGIGPREAAYMVAGILALWFAYDLMRKPIQVSDSLQELIDVQQSPSLWATFVAHSPRGPFLRPLKQVQTKLLFDLAGGHYWLFFRGFHALSIAAALLLFTRALRVQAWPDAAAAIFALTVLTGLHTFRGLVREAFPINLYLESVLGCLIVLNLAQSRPSVWTDVAAAITFVIASLTVESGVLVWVVLVAAWACGLRGVTWRGVTAVTLLLVAYLGARFALSIAAPGLDVGRDSGFGTRMLETGELARRFGENPTWFYAYNVGTSILSVLFSDPDRGVFHTVRTWLDGEMPARLYLPVVTSAVTTALIAFVSVARWRYRAATVPAASVQLLNIFTVILIANAVVSYAYTKHEIISVAGAFYAFAAYAAVRYAIDIGGPHARVLSPNPAGSRARPFARIAVCALLGALASAWAFRSAGVHHMLQTQAFRERLEWARLDPERIGERGYPSDARARALTAQLRQDALDLRIANTNEVPAWADDWWGE